MRRLGLLLSALILAPITTQAQKWQASFGTNVGRIIPEQLCSNASSECAVHWGEIVEVDRILIPWLQLSASFSQLNGSHKLGSRFKGKELFEQYAGAIGLRASKHGRFSWWGSLSLGYVEQVTLLHGGDYISEKQRLSGPAAIWGLGVDHSWAEGKWGVRVRFLEFVKWSHTPFALRRTGLAITRALPPYNKK